jgi:hypothetical protein
MFWKRLDSYVRTIISTPVLREDPIDSIVEITGCSEEMAAYALAETKGDWSGAVNKLCADDGWRGAWEEKLAESRRSSPSSSSESSLWRGASALLSSATKALASVSASAISSASSSSGSFSATAPTASSGSSSAGDPKRLKVSFCPEVLQLSDMFPSIDIDTINAIFISEGHDSAAGIYHNRALYAPLLFSLYDVRLLFLPMRGIISWGTINAYKMLNVSFPLL